MPRPTAGDVHVNAPLTNISVAYVQDATNFVAGRVFPEVPVTKQSDRYYTYDRGDFNRDEMEKRAAGTESAGGGFDIDNTPTYFCDEYAFHHDVPDPVRDNSDAAHNPDRAASTFVAQKDLIRREVGFASRYFSEGIWDNQREGSASSPGSGGLFLQWDDAASTPVEDVRDLSTDIQESTGFRPNVLTLQRRVFDKLVDHPDLVDRVKYGGSNNAPAMVNMAALAALFEVDEVLVMGGIKNTANQGQTAAHSFIGGKHALLAYRPPAPALMTPSAGYTFVWTSRFGNSAHGSRIKKFRMEPIESDRIEIQATWDQKVVSTALGGFFANAIA